MHILTSHANCQWLIQLLNALACMKRHSVVVRHLQHNQNHIALGHGGTGASIQLVLDPHTEPCESVGPLSTTKHPISQAGKCRSQCMSWLTPWGIQCTVTGLVHYAPLNSSVRVASCGSQCTRLAAILLGSRALRLHADSCLHNLIWTPDANKPIAQRIKTQACLHHDGVVLFHILQKQVHELVKAHQEACSREEQA